MTELTKRELAKWRNSNKYMLSKVIKPLTYMQQTLTKDEIAIINSIRVLHSNLMNNWKDNSILLGLKVAPKCWCGKIARYKAEYPVFHTDKLVCKKHRTLDFISTSE